MWCCGVLLHWFTQGFGCSAPHSCHMPPVCARLNLLSPAFNLQPTSGLTLTQLQHQPQHPQHPRTSSTPPSNTTPSHNLTHPPQGFPDCHVFVSNPNSWLEELDAASGSDPWRERAKKSLELRYQQIGNAVAPPMAKALGRCLLLALAGKSPRGQAVIDVPDPELCQVGGWSGAWCSVA